MKRKGISFVVILLVTSLLLTSCSSTGAATSPKAGSSDTAKTTIKLGITGDDDAIWAHIKDVLADEGYDLQIVSFSDYNTPNQALADGDIDANAFQTEIYFDDFCEQSGADLSVLGYTVLAPMGIYPGTSSSIDDIPDGSKVGVPNDKSNEGRALRLLQSAGLLTVDPDAGLTPTKKDITANPKNLDVVELAPEQIPASIDEFSVACINNGVAVDAGLSPLDDSIFREDPNQDYMKAYYNIIACQTSDLDDPALQALLAAYQTDDTKQIIEDTYKGATLPIW